ncbi:ubiquinol oxidase subunit II [Buchnera aphidicola]|uniref:Ubiquinol oxidase subunit 2 n=1 Tax=Buchnera aphidicola subsp. Tuberolachnus salignus TaxID=98804 RepID=A0A160SX56_BUCTT|nr:ubiquinol oxidase subunit II [Buchnera aphidicola]CUR53278.1 Cytochrome bo(3) ubiquinol oxidase subunit 2 [Buchnera aphidicola (Tuberolachnus salignus)]
MFKNNNIKKFYKIFILCGLSFFLTAYSKNNFFNFSSGLISQIEYSLMWTVFKVMLIIVIPVFFLTFFILYKYHKNNRTEIYQPDWSHSYKIEIVIWLIPILMVLFLSHLSYKYTHLLEPHKNIKSSITPIVIEAVSLDWRWLFIYPKYKIATINEIVIPINTPIHFKITSYSVMNSFFIPSLGSQIYSMAGMKTQLNLISNTLGNFTGISSNYSGAGFSNMKFQVRVVKNFKNFYKWKNRVQKSILNLNTLKKFLKLATPTDNFKIKYFSSVNKNLFQNIINLFK